MHSFAPHYVEEEDEHAGAKRTAAALSEGAERWRSTLHAASYFQLAGGGLLLVALAIFYGGPIFLGASMLWTFIQLMLGLKPSLCRTVGCVAMGLAMASMAIAPGPGHLATPFFELPLCLNTTAAGLYSVCSATPASRVSISLDSAQLDSARSYRPVLFMPSGSHATMLMSIEDADGAVVFMPTKLELGPDDLTYPWTTAVAAATSATPTASASAPIGIPAAMSVAPAATSFSAASRRRLRGMMRLGGGLGGLSGMGRSSMFSRGSGTFGAPLRGASQGPSQFGRGPTNAFGGGRTGGVPVARPVGRPGAVGGQGARYYHNTPYVGGGYVPSMGYHPSFGFDIATGMMIGHMLRTPHHRPAHNVIRGPGSQQPAASQTPQLMLAPPPFRMGSYYYGASALHAGSGFAVVPLATGTSFTPKSTMRTINGTYDRYALVDEVLTPAAPHAWPLRLVLTDIAFAPKAATATAASASPPSPLYLGLQAAGHPQLPSTLRAKLAARALYLSAILTFLVLGVAAFAGAQSASARHEELSGYSPCTPHPAPRTPHPAPLHPCTLHHVPCTLALTTPTPSPSRSPSPSPSPRYDSASDGGMELGAIERHGALGSHASAYPGLGYGGGGCGGGGCGAFGGQPSPSAHPPSGGTQPRISADGELLTVGSRVQTQHMVADGGDGGWYAGTVLEVHAEPTHPEGTVTIIYDDGEEWMCRVGQVYMLQGEAEETGPQAQAQAQAQAGGGGHVAGCQQTIPVGRPISGDVTSGLPVATPAGHPNPSVPIAHATPAMGHGHPDRSR